MKCHGRQIKVKWLEDINNKEKYDIFIDDAFQQQDLLNDQEQSQNGKQQNKEKLESLQVSLIAQDEKEDLNMQLKKNYIILPEDEMKEFVLYKKGGLLGSIMQRPCKIKDLSILQLKSKGSKIISKEYDAPIKINVETKLNFTKELVWDDKQQGQARIVFRFDDQKKVIWIYMQTVLEATKWETYMRTQQAQMKNNNIVSMFQTSSLTVQSSMSSHLINQFHQYAQFLARSKLFAARLAKKEKGFLENIDKQFFNLYLLQKWKNQSSKYRNQEIDLLEEKQKEAIMKSSTLENEQEKQYLKDQQKQKSLKKKCLNIDSGIYMRRFSKKWLKKTQVIFSNDSLSKTEYILTFRSILIEEKVKIIQPLLEVSLQGERSFQKDLSQSVLDNIKDIAGDLYFKLLLIGKISQKNRDNLMKWSLSESEFQNFSGVAKVNKVPGARRSSSLHLANLSPKDKLCFKVFEQIPIFEAFTSEPLVVKVSDILAISFGRSIWLSLNVSNKNINGVKKFVEDSKLYLEVDVQPLPSVINVEGGVQSYEDEFKEIIRRKLPIVDPIFCGSINLPEMSVSIIKAVLMIIQQNNPPLQQSMRLLSYQFYSASNQSSFEINSNELKRIIFRLIQQNICFMVLNPEKQLINWNQLSGVLIQQLSLKNTNDYLLIQQLQCQLQKGPNNIISKYLVDFGGDGFPIHLRPLFWNTLMNVTDTLTQLKDVLSTHFEVHLKPKKLNYPQYAWYFRKLLNEIIHLKMNIRKEIQHFLSYQIEKQGFTDESQNLQINDLICAFFLFYQSLGIQFNIQLLQYFFIIATKVHQMSCYNFVKLKPRENILQDTQHKDAQHIEVEKSFIQQKTENMALSFFILNGLLKSVLKNYPFQASVGHQNLLEECSYLTCYLIKHQKILNEHLILYEVKPETIFYEAFLSLYSDIFLSEQLFRLWDQIIFEYARLKDGEKFFFIPSIMAALLNRISTKVHIIYTQFDLIQLIKFEAILISDFNQFTREINEAQVKLKQAVQSIIQEEGGLPGDQESYEKAVKQQKHRIFAINSNEIDRKQNFEPMEIHQYLEQGVV